MRVRRAKSRCVSLHTVIEQALAFCEHVIAQHSAKVERAFADGVPPVRGMHEQLVQVFVNLFTNACHAMPADGGALTVRTELIDEGIHLAVYVEDNGHGIAVEHLAQIFAPFFTTKVDGRGTGLGLSIVKNIMDNHSAEIRAERAEAGARGSCWCFRCTSRNALSQSHRAPSPFRRKMQTPRVGRPSAATPPRRSRNTGARPRLHQTPSRRADHAPLPFGESLGERPEERSAERSPPPPHDALAWRERHQALRRPTE